MLCKDEHCTMARTAHSAMSKKRIVVCEAQVPFVQGGAEYHVRSLVAQLRGLVWIRARQRAVQVVSEGRNPGARRGVAAARPQREQRTADRSGHRHEVSVLFRAASEQGRVADSPVPRRLRAVRHALQRFRRTPRATSGLRDTLIAPRHARCWASAGACSPTPATRPPACAKFNGLDGRGAVSSAPSGADGCGRALRRLRPVGRPPRSVKRVGPRGPGDGHVDRPTAAGRGRRRHAAREHRARLAESLGVADRVDVPRRGAATTSCSSSTRVRWPSSTRRSTRTSATSRSKRSWRASRSITARLRRAARVRRRRRQRRVVRRRARGDRRRDQRARCRPRLARPALGDAGLRARAARSPGTASSRSWLGDRRK